MAAWYYKWYSDRSDVARRPRPVEYDYRVSVLYNRQVNDRGTGDGERRLLPAPSPGTPRHPSYPSGHSTYAGAASELLAYFFPDYTDEFDRLADNAGMARLWAEIHYRSDHIQGMNLGRHVAQMIIAQLTASCVSQFPDPCPPSDACHAQPPTRDELIEQASQHSSGRAGQPSSVGPNSRGASASASSADMRKHAATSQEGAAVVGSNADEQKQASSPQEGAAVAGSPDRSAEQASGPQEGAH